MTHNAFLETSHQKTCDVINKAISRQNEKHAKIMIWFNLDLVALSDTMYVKEV